MPKNNKLLAPIFIKKCEHLRKPQRKNNTQQNSSIFERSKNAFASESETIAQS